MTLSDDCIALLQELTSYLFALLLAKPGLIGCEEWERWGVAVNGFYRLEVSHDPSDDRVLERRFVLGENASQLLKTLILIDFHKIRVLVLEHLHEVRVTLEGDGLFRNEHLSSF